MKLPRSFYRRPTLEVAKDLLGKQLLFNSPTGIISGEINEVEAYLGEDDPASHAYRGMTKRNKVMFLEGGYSYVYFIYGMYSCFNVTTEKENVAGAVLIRSVIPMKGIEMMRMNTGKPIQKEITLTNGPGKLCQAFGITREQNAIDLVNSQMLYIEDTGKKVTEFTKTPRIGISQAINNLWRFVYYE